ncbi:MAG TPA: YncE family protein [Nitrospiria bacterium]
MGRRMTNSQEKKERVSQKEFVCFIFGLFFLFTIFSGCGGKSTGRAYISMGATHQIIELDLSSNRIIRRFEGGYNPHGLAITPDGLFLYATSTKESPKEMKHSPMSGRGEHDHGDEPVRGKDTPRDNETGNVVMVETSNGKVVAQINVGAGTHHGVVTPDGRFAVFSVPSQGGIAVVSTSTQQVIHNIKTGAVSNYVLATKDGKDLYVSNTGDGTVTSINTQTWLVRKQIKVGKGPGHLVESPDGHLVYVVNAFDETVSLIERRLEKEISVFKVGANPHGIDVHPSGKTVFVANQNDNTVTLYDTHTQQTKTWTVGESPYHLSVDPNNKRVFVGSRSLGKIWILNAWSGKIQGEIETGPVPHQMVFKK